LQLQKNKSKNDYSKYCRWWNVPFSENFAIKETDKINVMVRENQRY
jgi:hypothetical protein